MPARRRSAGAQPYDTAYRRERRALLAAGPACAFGCGRPATTADHRPALADHAHINGTGCCVLVPACWPCNSRHGARLGNAIQRSGAALRRGGGWSAST